MDDKYDDASWHYGGEFPADLAEEAGATHIGMFLAWAVLEDLGSAEMYDDLAETVEQLRARQLTPGAFAMMLDGKFSDADLGDEGNAFTRAYYDSQTAQYGQYLVDYEETLGGAVTDLYRVEDSWESFDRLKPVLDRRLAEWRARLSN